MNWALEGCRLWQAEQLDGPDAVINAVLEYRSEEDLLGQYIQERLTRDANGLIARRDLIQDYERWATDAGITHPLTQIKLVKATAGTADD